MFFFLHVVVKESDYPAQSLDLNPVRHLRDEPEGRLTRAGPRCSLNVLYPAARIQIQSEKDC